MEHVHETKLIKIIRPILHPAFHPAPYILLPPAYFNIGLKVVTLRNCTPVNSESHCIFTYKGGIKDRIGCSSVADVLVIFSLKKSGKKIRKGVGRQGF